MSTSSTCKALRSFSRAHVHERSASEREGERRGGVEREEREEERLFTLHAMHHMYVTDFLRTSRTVSGASTDSNSFAQRVPSALF